ncbi:MAG: nitrophenyl compound nitroreductase subunit ArsF family protein [Desulfurivibrionaceae bacterium]
MKAPRIRICLILFLTFVFLNSGIISGFAAADHENSTASESGDYIVYYFHTDYRCSSCERIEEWSEDAVKSGFARALQEDRLQWQVHNVDRQEYKHFVRDFDLYTKSLVIVEQEDGEPVRWKNLDQVWQLLRNKEKFTEYVQSEIKAFMEKN